MPSTLRRSALILPLLLWACTPSPDRPAERILPPADASLSHGFSNITGLVELSDGRVVLSDPREGSLYVGDFDSNSVQPIGRSGAGPLEYLNAIGLVEFGDDSILQVDGMSRRWLLLAGDSIVGQVAPDDPLLGEVPVMLGADRFGNILHLDGPPTTPAGGTISAADSIHVVLVSRRTGRRDSIAWLRPSPPMPPGTDRQPYIQMEQAVLVPDGWVAVIRLNPYRVDWRSPEGTWTFGPALPVSPTPLNATEREWFGRSTGASNAGAEWHKRFQWPEQVPPAAFQFNRLVSSAGDLLIRRQATRVIAEGLYDRVDRRGVLIEQVRVEPNQRIVALGEHHAYVVTTDHDGLQWMSRHVWPPNASVSGEQANQP